MMLKDFTLVFDLDGTLVDSAPDLVNSLNAALAHEGLPPMMFKDVKRLVGQGALALIQRALHVHHVKLDTERQLAMLDIFLHYYAEHICDDSLVYPPVEATLKQLKSLGAQCAVCTNKPEKLAVALLRHLKLDHYFTAICGGDTFVHHKPHAGHIIDTVARARGNISQTIMIGDSATDLLAARASGVPVILVDYGYTDTPAHELEADAVISDFSQLPDALNALIRLETRARAAKA
jgi:phosphoglycolate phosphatase